jgi:hypothetical protein
MKNPLNSLIATVVVLLFIWLAFSSCNLEKMHNRQFQTAVNKYGQKESVKFITDAYPEYFVTGKSMVKDTITNKGVSFDTTTTLEALHDTITIYKDKVTVREVFRNGGIYTSIKSKADTFYKIVPCPGTITPNTAKINSGFKPDMSSGWTWQWAIVGFCISLVLFAAYKFLMFYKSHVI